MLVFSQYLLSNLIQKLLKFKLHYTVSNIRIMASVNSIDCSQLDQTQIKHLSERCIVVDSNDIIGSDTKKNCHLKTNIKQKRFFHRDFSVFLINSDGSKMLLQQRAASKITYPNLWSTACCSHPLFEIEKERDSGGGSN